MERSAIFNIFNRADTGRISATSKHKNNVALMPAGKEIFYKNDAVRRLERRYYNIVVFILFDIL